MTIRCSQCDRTFSVADDARGETVCPLCREAADIEPGTVLDDFRVDALLARGGMATVYRGTQISLNRPVAIKVLAQELTERPQFVERFRSEARLMAQLDHASVVKALGAGASQGAFYIAMEYVDGESLAARLARTGKLPLQEAVGLVDGVAAALEYAHGQNVVHRDIKPANVLIGADGRPKVTDFGIARLTGADDAVQNRLTVPHSQMGSAHYMAPEQMKDASSVDHRADIYALGVLLYETLTGEPPVGQFKPASQMAEGVPGQVDQVIRHALAPNRDERLATAAQFRALLQRAASGAAPPRAQHPPRTRLSRVPVQEKKRTGLFVAAAALLAVGVALFLLLRSGDKEPDKPTSPDPTVAQSKTDSPTPRPAPAVQVDPVAPPRPEPDPELDLAPLPGPELALAAAPGPEPPPGPAHLQFPPAQGDWTPLFDGKTLAGWTTRKGAWSVDGDAIVCKVGSQDALCTLDGAEFGDFVLEADVRNLGPGPRFGLIFRKKGDNYISFGLNGQFNGITCKAGSGVWKATLDGVTIQRLPAAGLKVEKDTWYTLRVVCHGERFACYVDDVLVVTGTDTALRSGQVGLCAHRANARFRNIRIRTMAPAAALAAANPPPEQERERPGPAFELNVRVRLDGKS
ncbi:protein kinase, partial [bacterium]|nr:protein kinase [bacterium]